MGVITRDPAGAVRGRYDLIVVGGGIYGVMLLLEAARRNLHALLLERDDFGGHTSFNSLRIIHGGLRYLQSLDLRRFRESVAERQWFLRTFPDLIRPLPCLMPLYGEGLRRPPILRAALAVNDFLSSRVRTKGPAANRLAAGGILDVEETRRLFPGVDQAGLKGSALWYDACMPDSQRVLMETLRWACGHGASALNYVEATALLTWKGKVRGVLAHDRQSRTSREYRAGVVVNAAGPWCRELGRQLAQEQDRPSLFRPSLAWNILLDRQPPADHALALTPRKPGAQTYFLVPWKGKLLAGTGHAPWQENAEPPQPSEKQLADFLAGLNLAAPGLEFSPADIRHFFAGLLPAMQPGTASLAKREVIVDHGREGGAEGLYSVSGVKFTTARKVAEKTLNGIFRHASPGDLPANALNCRRGIFLNGVHSLVDNETMRQLDKIACEESVCRLEDLLMRRTDLWLDASIREKLPALNDLVFGPTTTKPPTGSPLLCRRSALIGGI
jgi:glycerol-3-phosphate dehydrogenase